MWLNDLSAGLWTERSLVQSPVRAHAWVAGQVPSGVVHERQATHWCFFPCLSSSPLFPVNLACPTFLLFFLKRFYLFSFRGEGREKERERNINVWFPLMGPLMGTWPATQACAVTRNRTRYPWVRRPALNPLSHTSQGTALFLFS